MSYADFTADGVAAVPAFAEDVDVTLSLSLTCPYSAVVAEPYSAEAEEWSVGAFESKTSFTVSPEP